MAVKVRINSREFTLTWEEFERSFYKATTCVEIVEIFEKREVVNS